MICFRSVNTRDKKLIDNKQDLLCRLAHNPNYEHYNLLMNGAVGNALDLIIRHVMGHGIMDDTTIWISLAKSFIQAAREYSIPQAGNYNPSMTRKSIIIVDYPDALVYKTADRVLGIRDMIMNDFIIDISDDNLYNFYEEGAISAKYDNDFLSSTQEFLRSLTEKGSIPGFSNYSSKVSEVLAYKKISYNYIKAVLEPELVDIIYACDIDLNNNNNLNFIINYYKDLNDTLTNLNTKYLGKNVFELLDYNKLNDYNASIEEYYQDLLVEKIKEIKEIVTVINNEFSKEFEVKRVLDEGILTCDFDNVKKNSSREKDILKIKRGKEIYLYNHENGKYCSTINNNKSFTFEEAKRKCLSK